MKRPASESVSRSPYDPGAVSARGRLKLKALVRVIRPSFFTITVVSVALGAAIAWGMNGSFSLGYFVLTILGALCAHGAINATNEYYDFLSGADVAAHEMTDFSGGSGVLPEGALSPSTVRWTFIVLFGIAFLIGIWISVERGWGAMLLALAGGLTGYAYTAPPLKFLYRGFGEIVLGVNFGPLLVPGSYYVQTGRFSIEPFVAGLAVGLSHSAAAYLNEFPDYETDKRVGKNNLVVELGRKRAVGVYIGCLAAVYGVLLAGVILRVATPWSLLPLVTVPWAVRAARIARRHYDDTAQLFPAMRISMRLITWIGLLLCLGYGIEGLG
jgi:1,4-dihydroxy-2-naphthoate polyprenyltransferase